MKEIWKNIPGFNNRYRINNVGIVQSNKSGAWKNKSLFLSERGYLKVCLGSSTNVKVHRLVAEAFIPRIKDRNQVNHKNFNKTDNTVDNLEWVTQKENMQHYLQSKSK